MSTQLEFVGTAVGIAALAFVVLFLGFLAICGCAMITKTKAWEYLWETDNWCNCMGRQITTEPVQNDE